MRIIRNLILLSSVGILASIVGCKLGTPAPETEEGNYMAIIISNNTFKVGEKIPRIYTCEDLNISPPLAWTAVPSNTVSLALVS